jgi:hypothetical protein
MFWMLIHTCSFVYKKGTDMISCGIVEQLIQIGRGSASIASIQAGRLALRSALSSWLVCITRLHHSAKLPNS